LELRVSHRSRISREFGGGSGEEESGHEMGHDCTIRMILKDVRGSEDAEISDKRTSALKSCKSGQDPSAVSTWFNGECAGFYALALDALAIVAS
jgi:hypothetical protein